MSNQDVSDYVVLAEISYVDFPKDKIYEAIDEKGKRR